MSKGYTVAELHQMLTDEIAKGRGEFEVCLYFHHTHTSAPYRSEHIALQGSTSEPAAWKLYLSTGEEEKGR